MTVASASEGPSDPFTGTLCILICRAGVTHRLAPVGGARYIPAGPSFTGGAGAPRPLPSGPSDPFTGKQRDSIVLGNCLFFISIGGARYTPANVSASSEQQVHCRRFHILMRIRSVFV